MPSILIANLGNRNLKYRGEFLDKDNFRDLTQNLWENYETERAHFDPVLLNEHLDDQQVEQIYLITTDQADSRYRAGDTLHEGAILQRLFAEDFPGWPIELLPYQGNPTVEAEIYSQLKPWLLALVNKYPTHKVIFLDAGGTPQLKNAVREYLRYAAGSARFLTVYITPQDERKEIDQTYHQRYQLLTAAYQFVERHQYRAAYEVLRPLKKTQAPAPLLLELLQIAAARMEFDRLSIAKISDQQPSSQLPEVFQNYVDGLAPSTLGLKTDIRDDEQRFDIAEIASLSQLYLQQENFSLAIPAYFRLCEEIGQDFALSKGFSTKTEEKYRRLIEQTKSQVSAGFINLRPKPGVPYLLAYAHTAGSQELRLLTTELIATISHVNGSEYKGLNMLRNRCFLAHGNNAVTKDAIKGEDRRFLGTEGRATQIFRLLGLPEINIYNLMKQELLQLLRQE